MKTSWGPFRRDLDPAERRAQLRSLRTLVKVMLGPRGRDAAVAILAAEIGQDDETLAKAETAFANLLPVDARRVLGSFSAVNFERAPCCSSAVITPSIPRRQTWTSFSASVSPCR